MTVLHRVPSYRMPGLRNPRYSLEHGYDALWADPELCCKCGEATGRAGKDEDSLYTDDDGPFCEDCFPEGGHGE